MSDQEQKKLSPFDFLASINSPEKHDLIRTAQDPVQAEKDYVSFIVNRGLSYFSDTILYSNEINKYPDLPKQAQYDFLRLSIRPRKRFSKWFKPEENNSLEVIKTIFNYSDQKASAILNVLTKEQIEELRNQVNLDKGGV